MPAGEIMRRFYAGTLKSSTGAPVRKLAQAKAIAASYGPENHQPARRGQASQRVLRIRERKTK